MKKTLLIILFAIVSLLIFTFGPGMIPFIILVALDCVLLYFICCFIFWVVEKAVIFSKISFSLLAAALLNVSYPLLETGGLPGFLLYAAIIGGGIFLLCLLPRINCAFKFLCTSLITYVCSTVISMGGINIILGLFSDKSYDQPTLVLQIILKLLTIVVSAVALMGTLENKNIHKFKNPIIVNFDRLLASAVYALAVLIIAGSGMTGNKVFWQYIVPFGGMAVAFVIDVIYTIYTRKKNTGSEQNPSQSPKNNDSAEPERNHNNHYDKHNSPVYDLQQAKALFMIDDLSNVTLSDIKAQRNRLIKTFHPDHGSACDNGYAQKINAAYEILKEHVSK